ncbi:MAG: GNAT family N-acetyltransferase [Flavobacteriales bacterium]|nr:GNAT family N-acetyltransferase [Flavobacteriales bacterium]
MKIRETYFLNNVDRSAIRELWNSEYPQIMAHDTDESLGAYLTKLDDAHHVLMEFNNQLVGWMCDFERNTERWFVIIIDRSVQHQGWGSHLLEYLDSEQMHYGWILSSEGQLRADGTPYPRTEAFYTKNGFTIEPVETHSENGLVFQRICRMARVPRHV